MAREPLMVVVDDPQEGFVVVPSEVAQKAGYAQLLGIKPEQVPKDPDKRAAMTALYRERKAARIAREKAANKALEEQNKPFLAEQARRAEASMAEAAAAPKLAKVPAVKALQNIQRFSEGPAPTPEPRIDVAPVGRMDAPAMPQNIATAPRMPTAPAVMAEEAPDWAQGFSPASTRTPDDEGRALLALAKSQSGAPAGARASAFAPSTEGIRSTSVPQAYAPEPMASASKAPNAEDEALLKELRDAQRSDGYSSGMRALGDQFRDAMNLILNIQGPKSNMAGTDGGYVSAAKARQALLAAQAKARRDERMTDATVESKETAQAISDGKLAKAKADLEAVQGDNDATSPASQQAQAIARDLIGGRVSEDVLKATPASQVGALLLKFGVSLKNAEVTAGISKDRLEQGATESAADRQLREQQAELARQKYALDLAEFAERRRQFDASLADKGAARAATEEEKKEAKARTLAERNVGGFTFNPEDPPSTDAAKKMADVSIARDRATIAINRLMSLYSKHGTELTGPVSGEMASEWKVATDELRKIGDMGVPNGNDYKMLAMQLPNPTESSDILRTTPRVLAHYKTVVQQLDRNVSTSAKAYKYTPAPASSRPPDLDLSTDVREPETPSASPSKAAGQPSRADRKFDPTKKEASRTYSADGKWLRIVYEDGTFGLGPSDRKK